MSAYLVGAATGQPCDDEHLQGIALVVANRAPRATSGAYSAPTNAPDTKEGCHCAVHGTVTGWEPIFNGSSAPLL